VDLVVTVLLKPL